ncbi:MAG: hypothetical protein RBU21_16725, partial [FCB group bacterium]|nr:hypothetical protein [FCB group bacterium]
MSKKSAAGPPQAASKRHAPEGASRELPAGLEWFVAVGLALVMLLRPVWDGSVYEYSNLWFLYGISILFAVWSVAFLMSGGSLRFVRHLALFGAFLAVAGLLGFGTIHADQTGRALQLWLSYLMLFLLTSNALRSRATVAVVFGAFVVATFGEVVFSWVHHQYILPYIRRQIMEHPTLLMSYFGAAALTPELASRLNANRAFGSFLFANALAAYHVLGIPYFIGELVNSYGHYRRLPRERAVEPGTASPYS